MGYATQTLGKVSSTAGGATSVTVKHLVVNSSTEVTQILPIGTKQFMVLSKGNATLNVAYVSGGTGLSTDEYIPVSGQSALQREGLNLTSTLILRILGSKADTAIIEFWV